MAKLQSRKIFENCEKLYDKFKKEDGGYYPSIHDELVFKEISDEFGISIEEAYKMYDSYSKLAAQIEVARINRLPKAKREAATMRRIRNIVLNNRDLPFYKTEGEPVDLMPSPRELIEEEYKDMIINMAKQGWTIPLTIEMERFEELKENASDVDKLDAFFIKFYTESEFNSMCNHILNIISNPGQKKRFEECIDIYLKGSYSSCMTVLTTVLEGFISTFGDDPKNVRVMRICSYHANEEISKDNIIESLCWQSMYEYSKILFEQSDFSQDEPDKVNRHWIIHGRTSKLGENVDCLRLFNALSTMTNIKDSQPHEN